MGYRRSVSFYERFPKLLRLHGYSHKREELAMEFSYVHDRSQVCRRRKRTAGGRRRLAAPRAAMRLHRPREASSTGELVWKETKRLLPYRSSHASFEEDKRAPTSQFSVRGPDIWEVCHRNSAAAGFTLNCHHSRTYQFSPARYGQVLCWSIIGGRGGCVKSNASRISLAVASRSVRGATLNRSSMKRRTDENS